ncbi:MAG: phytanoyl-CoA dioxygenase family protein [Myxococcaceae bacterium]
MNLQDKSILKEQIDGAPGYALGLKFENQELRRLKALIEIQWLKRLNQIIPEQVPVFSESGIERYHELSHLLEHSKIWSKTERILPVDAVLEIREMSLFKTLRQEFGNFSISDEEAVGWEEIYWRLVRPNQAGDVGPLHADKWFWDLGHGVTQSGIKRIKIWIAIVCERGLNGLCVVPGSHLREWNYHGEQRYGSLKPQIDEREESLDVRLMPTNPGDAVIFNDGLLHKGIFNSGNKTRVSLEFTMLVGS